MPDDVATPVSIMLIVSAVLVELKEETVTAEVEVIVLNGTVISEADAVTL